MAERVDQNEVTRRRGHRVFVVYVAEKDCFAFTCDSCNETSPVAISALGYVVCVLKKGSTQ